MSVIYVKKDITTVTEGVIVHGCNCQGVMGSGVAKALRAKYPVIFDHYKEICDVHAGQSWELLGHVDFVEIESPLHDNELIIANCFTQDRYGRTGGPYATVDAIERSLTTVLQFTRELQLSLYMPEIAGGLGGLNFIVDVKPIIEKLAEDVPETQIYVCIL